jgi:hypothetical protein
MGPGAGVDDMKRRNISCPYRGSNPCSRAHNLAATVTELSRHTMFISSSSWIRTCVVCSVLSKGMPFYQS